MAALPDRPLRFDPPTGRLDDLVKVAARRWPDTPAIVAPGTRITFAELDTQVSRVAAALRQLLGPRSATVAIGSSLEPEFAIAYFAVSRAGYRIAPVIPLLPEEPLYHVLSTCRANLVLGIPLVASRVSLIRDRLPDLLGVAPLTADRHPAADLPSLPDMVLDGGSGGRGGPPAGANGDPQDTIACVQFTSGTTGLPKAVLLTHGNLTVNAWQMAEAHDLTSESVTLNHLPTYHPMHLTSAVFAGATQVLCPDPDPVAAFAEADRHGVTHYYSLPVRLARLAEDPRLADIKPRTVRVVLSGGSALAPEAARTLSAQLGVPVIQGYGLAETSPLTHSDSPDDPHPGSVGGVVPQTECRIVDIETRVPLDPGVKGEVQVRGPQVMAGYLDPEHPDKPVPAVDADGWLSTGDVGYLDQDGRLYLVDRIKDVYKYDNWLVSPAEIELVLASHPAVSECAVVDTPAGVHGSVGHGFVVLRPEVPPPSPQELAEYVNSRVPYYQRLDAVTVVPIIPRSGAGKVLRRVLRESLTQDNTASGSTQQGGSTMVTLLNRFTLHVDGEEFERVFAASSLFMRQQPGFIRHRLVRSLRDPKVYVNIAEWESPEHHMRAVRSDQFQVHIQELAKVATADPALYATVQEVEVEG